MRYFLVFWIILSFYTCHPKMEIRPFKTVSIDVLWEDSVSIRALEIMPGSVAFAGASGVFGTYTLKDSMVRIGKQTYEATYPEFRAVAHTATDFFMLSVGTPALLFKTGKGGQMELVYRETGPNVFYDAMAFWDDLNGIAVGDAQQGCLSILITRDGGGHWEKMPCSALPSALEGEGAFAASNTNISIIGTHCWIGSSQSRIYFSEDLGKTWSVSTIPLATDGATRGIYSVDFADALTGFAIGGDYTQPELDTANKARTLDGGKTWELVANGNLPGYKSCVQYIPETNGLGLIAVGFTGISQSSDGGKNWFELSDEPFYTLRFVNGNEAYAAGKGRLARLQFR
ncbi:MAG: hypothetical protein RLZZ241_2465 [Bacteroidota bacterium]|jgi:photosystem II stability/assembly factor-like uncharacterized protein